MSKKLSRHEEKLLVACEISEWQLGLAQDKIDQKELDRKLEEEYLYAYEAEHEYWDFIRREEELEAERELDNLYYNKMMDDDYYYHHYDWEY